MWKQHLAPRASDAGFDNPPTHRPNIKRLFGQIGADKPKYMVNNEIPVF
jgi:hypothetical protein